MSRRVAKEYLHINGWLHTVASIVECGEREYLRNAILQEAGDSLLVKMGEASNRLYKSGEPDPSSSITWADIIGLRTIVAHEYDKIQRHRMWGVLHSDLPQLAETLRERFIEANAGVLKPDGPTSPIGPRPLPTSRWNDP